MLFQLSVTDVTEFKKRQQVLIIFNYQRLANGTAACILSSQRSCCVAFGLMTSSRFCGHFTLSYLSNKSRLKLRITFYNNSLMTVINISRVKSEIFEFSIEIFLPQRCL